MHRTVVMLTLALVVGIAVGTVGNQVLIAQQQPVTRTILQQKDLEGAAGREVIMYRAEAIPGGVAGRHYHPGPELVYVLEGALVLEPDGQPPITLKAGESAHMPAKHIHNAKNASTTAPVKVLVFLVGEKGQALATPVQ
ncbi:MAG TPA: cupin domain-containing protein [Candidatus Tectomicrobia bacterium]|nr:cupin domain-containing protein [Candidatus Tectomicrobia bacterium]